MQQAEEEKLEKESPAEVDSQGIEEEEVHPMDALLQEEEYSLERPRRGQIRTGTIARMGENDVLVDIGAKSEGVIPPSELEKLPAERLEELSEGQEVTVFVVRSGGRDGLILLSLSRAEEEEDWKDAERMLEAEENYEGIISGSNKGGLILKVGHLRGFVPASQVSLARRRRAQGESPDERWGEMVDEPMVAKVIEVDRKRNRLILSERAATREAREMLKERLIETLEPGEVRTGYVISLADFGAFVDIGGADGLVHTSEISWKRIEHPSEVLKVGQEVQVKVLDLDRSRNRISLSLRELEQDPWEQIAAQFKEGQLVEGQITKLTNFGAFARLTDSKEYEVEGLIHISELSDRRIEHPREVVEEAETLTLRVIRVDPERRRIGLSLRKVDSTEYADIDWQQAMEETPEPAVEVEEVVEDFDAELEAESKTVEAEQTQEPAEVEAREDEATVEAEDTPVEEELETVDEEAAATADESQDVSDEAEAVEEVEAQEEEAAAEEEPETVDEEAAAAADESQDVSDEAEAVEEVEAQEEEEAAKEEPETVDEEAAATADESQDVSDETEAVEEVEAQEEEAAAEEEPETVDEEAAAAADESQDVSDEAEEVEAQEEEATVEDEPPPVEDEDEASEPAEEKN